MNETEISTTLHRLAVALAFTSAFAFGCGGVEGEDALEDEALSESGDQIMVIDESDGSGGFTTTPKCTAAQRSATLWLDYAANGISMWGKSGPHIVHDAEPGYLGKPAIRYDLRWRRRGTTAWTTVNYYGPAASMTTCNATTFSRSMCVWAEPVTPGYSYEFQQVITCSDGSKTLGSLSCVFNGVSGYNSGTSCIFNVPAPTTPYCGDGMCNNGEDSSSCPYDCPKVCPKGYRSC